MDDFEILGFLFRDVRCWMNWGRNESYEKVMVCWEEYDDDDDDDFNQGLKYKLHGLN